MQYSNILIQKDFTFQAIMRSNYVNLKIQKTCYSIKTIYRKK